MKRVLYFAGLILIPLMVISCRSQKQGDKEVSTDPDSLVVQPARPPFINVPDLLEKSKDVFLSEFAASVTYIPLETTRDFMIGDNSVHVKPCGEYLFVSEHGKPVGVFDRNGKFIRKIGSIGKGPGEYNFDFIFWPEESSRQVFVWNADNGTIMVFSFEGRHIKDIVPEIQPMAFAPLGNDRFFTWNFMQKELNGNFYRIIFHDGSGVTTGRIFEPKIKYDFSQGVSIMSPLITPAPVGFLYYSWENDTIFRAKPDGSFEPAFCWNIGKYAMPADALKNYSRFLREKDNYILDFIGFEGQSNWYLRYEYKGRKEMAICGKRTGEVYLVANPDTAQMGVWNDIDGGPSFFPTWDNEKGRVFVRMIHSIDLLDYQKQKTKPSLPVKDIEAAGRFKSILAAITENSNPIVMLVEMR